jgi:hypothetical protein
MRLSEPLPSWVPDWAVNTPLVRPFYREETENSFNACKGYPYRPVPSPAAVLIVRGKIVTSVNIVHPYAFEKQYFMDADRNMLNLDYLHEEMVSVLLPGRPTYSRQRILRALLADGATAWRNRTVHRPEESSSLSDERIEELLHAYDMWPRINEGDTTIPYLEKVKDDLVDLQQQSLILQRKRPAGCTGVKLALVPRMCLFKESCEIVILHGSKVPIVMVEMDEAANERQVVGQCYVEGAMYGEAVDWEEEDGEVFRIV